MRIIKKNVGGYLTQLESSRPELFKTVKSYRDRLTTPEQKTFDQRANIQLAASRNMPENQRQAYYASIEKEYGQPSEEQFQQVREGLKSKTFTPTYSYYTPAEQSQQQGKTAATTGYYRDLSKEMADLEKQMKGLTLTTTEQRTRPKYEVTYPQRSMYGQQKSPTYTTTLPKGAVLRQGNYGQQFYQKPSSDPFLRPQDAGPRYRKVGDEKYTVSNTRAQRAGDPEYDKMARQLTGLQTRHKYRFGFGDETPKTTQDIYGSFGPTSFKNPYEALATKRMKKGGEMKGQGKAIRGFKFGGVK